jgi:hypothetical protein
MSCSIRCPQSGAGTGKAKQKAKGKYQKSKGRHFIFLSIEKENFFIFPLLPFAICLLPFAFRL